MKLNKLERSTWTPRRIVAVVLIAAGAFALGVYREEERFFALSLFLALGGLIVALFSWPQTKRAGVASITKLPPLAWNSST